MTQHEHAFVPYDTTEGVSAYMCRKCGAIAENTIQIQSHVDAQDCISNEDPRCGDTARAINQHRAEMAGIDPSTIEYDIAEVEPTYIPTTLQSHKLFLEWLNSPDPIKALWGIED